MMVTMEDGMNNKRTMFKEDGNEWCKVTIELRDRNGRGLELSITGEQGYILDEDDAQDQAREYWLSFFEESDEEFGHFVKRFPEANTPELAADLVLECDGEYHGLDISHEEDGKVYVGSCWGQIRDEIAQWFPEVAPFFKWHLNGMRAGCVHQETVKRVTGKTYETGDRCCCGYRYGHAWNHEELPPAVVKWAMGE